MYNLGLTFVFILHSGQYIHLRLNSKYVGSNPTKKEYTILNLLRVSSCSKLISKHYQGMKALAAA